MTETIEFTGFQDGMSVFLTMYRIWENRIITTFCVQSIRPYNP